MVHPELLEILRCPNCVSGPDRKPGDDPGQLELVREGTWLVCLETDCGRKYPIREDIPIMLIDEGDKWINVAIDDLPEPGPLVQDEEYKASAHQTAEEAGAGPVGRFVRSVLGLVRGPTAGQD